MLLLFELTSSYKHDNKRILKNSKIYALRFQMLHSHYDKGEKQKTGIVTMFLLGNTSPCLFPRTSKNNLNQVI